MSIIEPRFEVEWRSMSACCPKPRRTSSGLRRTEGRCCRHPLRTDIVRADILTSQCNGQQAPRARNYPTQLPTHERTFGT
jgi:hypothetical protein